MAINLDSVLKFLRERDAKTKAEAIRMSADPSLRGLPSTGAHIDPKTGTASLYCELLDESFNRLEKSDSITVIFEDKGYGPPPQEQGPPSD